MQLDTSDTPGYNADFCVNITSNTEGQPPLVDIDGEMVNAKELHYIRPLLGASSRLGRTLAELFGLLVKLCVGTQIRQRRGQSVVATPVYPSPTARCVAAALNYLLAAGLDTSWLPNHNNTKFKLIFLISNVGFTNPMLFDEKRFPYYLMLERFVSRGGRATFFKTFKWALSAAGNIPLEEALEHPNLPVGKLQTLYIFGFTYIFTTLCQIAFTFNLTYHSMELLVCAYCAML